MKMMINIFLIFWFSIILNFVILINKICELFFYCKTRTLLIIFGIFLIFLDIIRNFITIKFLISFYIINIFQMSNIVEFTLNCKINWFIFYTCVICCKAYKNLLLLYLKNKIFGFMPCMSYIKIFFYLKNTSLDHPISIL